MLLFFTFHIWLLSVTKNCFQSIPWIQCTQLLLTIIMAVTTQNLEDVEQKCEDVEQKCEMSDFKTWSEAQNFSFNLILEFLDLTEVVKLLTIVHVSQQKFVPSSTLLSEILRKALRSSLSGIPFYSRDREKRPTLLMTSKDKTLSLNTICQLFNLIKKTIRNECELGFCIAKFEFFFQCITTRNDLCIIWNHEMREEGKDEEDLHFKMIFASSQCSDRECNQIVLWHCSICENPCSECLDHVTICELCLENACTDCLVNDNLCKDCGFICVGCGGLFIVEDDLKFICEGSECGRSCPSAVGPYCSDCAWPEDDPVPHISLCCICCQMACTKCDIIMWCETCKDQYCYDCMPLSICYVCDRMICDTCEPMILHCEQVRSTQFITFTIVSPYCLKKICLPLLRLISLLFSSSYSVIKCFVTIVYRLKCA
jgi:hypothetical protein